MTQQPNPADPAYPDGGAPTYPSDPTRPVETGAGQPYPSFPPPPSPDTSSWNQSPPPPSGYQVPPNQNAWQQNFGSPVSGDAMTPQQERTWGMLAHLIPLVCFVLSAGTLGFVASLVIFILFKDRGPFVRAHAANSLNVQIITGIGLLISAVLMLLLIGFITYPVICVWAIVIHIIASSKASAGQWYNPPLTPRIVR